MKCRIPSQINDQQANHTLYLIGLLMTHLNVFFFRMAQMKQTSHEAEGGTTTIPSRWSQRVKVEQAKKSSTGTTSTPAVASQVGRRGRGHGCSGPHAPLPPIKDKESVTHMKFRENPGNCLVLAN